MKSIVHKIVVAIIVLLAIQTTFAQESPKATLLDSFTYSNSEDGSARIDNLRIMLNNSPNDGSAIIIYGGKVSKKGEIEAHIRGIRQAFNQKMIEPPRFTIIKGGYREKVTIEFWIVPQGAELPKPTPTIDAKKVRVKGVSKKVIPYECCF